MKNKNGITLVALVITIIVLLILAGVAIRAVVGDNGVLKQSTKASKTSKYKSEIELAETQIEYFTEGNDAGKIDLVETEKAVKKLDEVSRTEIIETSSGAQLKITFKDEKTHTIDGIKKEDDIVSNDVTGVYYAANGDTRFTIEIKENTLTLYGDEVGYTYDENDNTITATVLGMDFIWDYEALSNTCKTLLVRISHGTPILYATDMNGLSTESITGKYKAQNYAEYFDFLGDTGNVGYIEKATDPERTFKYMFFDDFDIGYVSDQEGWFRWYKLEGNNLRLFSDEEQFADEIYVKQN